MSIIGKEFDKILEEIKNIDWFRSLENLKEMLPGRQLVLYGCGQICKEIIALCEQLDIKVTAVCDSKRTGIYDDTGFTIISPKELVEKYKDEIIIITSKRFEYEIARQLYQLGFSDEQIYPFPLPHPYVLSSEVFKERYLEGFKYAYEFFEDYTSRKIILDRMRMYLLGTNMSRTSTSPEYFEQGIISLSENEIFVDGGCYKGETAEEFIKQIKSKNPDGYYYVYSFEPDNENYQIAVKNLKKYKYVEVIEKGLWSDETTLMFSTGGDAGSSFIFGRASVSVPVTSIDKFFEGKPYSDLPTYIKMDIEGAEKEALIGAQNIIRRKHPKLAVCVYHKPEDIYELPKLIYEIDPGYQFYLHQYSDGIYDTVLYAI